MDFKERHGFAYDFYTPLRKIIDDGEVAVFRGDDRVLRAEEWYLPKQIGLELGDGKLADKLTRFAANAIQRNSPWVERAKNGQTPLVKGWRLFAYLERNVPGLSLSLEGDLPAQARTEVGRPPVARTNKVYEPRSPDAYSLDDTLEILSADPGFQIVKPGEPILSHRYCSVTHTRQLVEKTGGDVASFDAFVELYQRRKPGCFMHLGGHAIVGGVLAIRGRTLTEVLEDSDNMRALRTSLLPRSYRENLNVRQPE